MNGTYKPHQAYAKEIMKYHAKSFYFAGKFLPAERRAATYAVYSFCRYADNIVDNPRQRSHEEILHELNELSQELENACNYGESENPAVGAYIASAKEYGIPAKYALYLLKGVEMDLTINRYDNFDELYLFCYRVAGVVGLMMTYVLGFEDEEALKYAEKLGIAMQLTNILRDIKEDKEMGRIYLPQNEMAEFGINDENVINEQFTDNFRKFMEFQVDRAQKYYEEANAGIKMLNRGSQFAIYAASEIYSGILDKIRKNDYNPFNERVFVPKSRKISILLSELLKRRIIPSKAN